MRLSNKIAIVTGAGSGFGEGIARTFAREGASVVVNDLDEEKARRVAELDKRRLARGRPGAGVVLRRRRDRRQGGGGDGAEPPKSVSAGWTSWSTTPAIPIATSRCWR